MSEQADIVRREDEQYRRGVVLGLTMAEVTILLLFCLLMAMVITLQAREKRIRDLQAATNGTVFVVNPTVVREMETEYGNVDVQSKIDEDFQKLILAARDEAKIADSLKDPEIPKDKDAPSTVQSLVDITRSARKVVEKSGQATASSRDVISGMQKITEMATQLRQSGQLRDLSTDDGKQAAKVAMATDICGLQYSDPKQQEECRKKVIEIAGGKGLEFQSCWWDKSTVPWRTKDIFDVALTDSGFIMRDIDPGVSEYQAQKAAVLPLSGITRGREIVEADFLSQTTDLLKWSEDNKCRFYVRVFDETGPNEKAAYKSRSEVVEQRFYPDKSKRRFAEAASGSP